MILFKISKRMSNSIYFEIPDFQKEIENAENRAKSFLQFVGIGLQSVKTLLKIHKFDVFFS